MVHGCGNRTLKFLFFITNLLTCVFGALLFGTSLWAYHDENFLQKLERVREIHKEDSIELTKHQIGLWLLIIIGASIFLVGFLGCCGAICESTKLLTLFSIIVLILAILEVASIVLIIAGKDQFKNALYNLLTKAGESEDEMQHFKSIEDLFHCCGPTNETMVRYIENGLCEGELKNKPNCFTVISDYFDSAETDIIKIFVVLIIIDLLALFSTSMLYKAFRYQTPYYYA
ncbi:hypothetical protein WUBG_09786 [Wuchereria bancrofti]|uniref:Tetraspanin n=1 Tax=Wuchereria bancrofti TaxID=6293 RepID=J9AXG4_WUCBA|nr:hypothetical protein WUBG_09786 [Wuchereria bancrofti]VDM18845.1 unnamed protein product [Wuchereria bancrofti]